MKLYFGIDPGKSGGLAALDESGQVIEATKMPPTEMDVADWFRFMIDSELEPLDPPVFATIEKVASSPQMGVKSAFTFGRGYGTLLGVLTALAIPFEEVSPRKWQGALGCLTGGDKNVSKRKAQQLWPTFKFTHATADAALIGAYGIRKRAEVVASQVHG